MVETTDPITRVPNNKLPENPNAVGVAEAASSPVAPEQHEAPRREHIVECDRRSGIREFFRAFGVTSGIMAALAVGFVGVPILACGGCLTWMLTVGGGAKTESSLAPLSSASSNGETSRPVVPSPPAKTDSDGPHKRQEGDQSPPAEPEIITTFPEVDLADREGVYLFKGPTVEIRDSYIREVRIADGAGALAKAEVMLDNTSGRPWVPRATLRLVNCYGVVLGSIRVHWLLSQLEAGQCYSEAVDFVTNRYDDLFRYAELPRPSGFDQPRFLVVEYE